MEIEYELNLREGIVYIQSVADDFPPLEIEVDKFFRWIRDKGLNGYCHDYFNAATNSHEQDSGYFNLEEYFENTHAIIVKDLSAYLKSKKLI